METVTQLLLPLFPEPTFNELLQQRCLAGRLTVIIYPRLRRGWRAKLCRRTGGSCLYVPTVLAEAPVPVKNALIEWALLPWRRGRRLNADIQFKKRELERLVWRHLSTLPGSPAQAAPVDTERLAPKTRGRIYDLREIFNSVNHTFFCSSLSSHLRWGPPLSKLSHHTTRTDRSGNTINLITIAGVYNHPAVPRFAIEAVMYHEMLHIAIPPWKKNGRRVIHGTAFKKAERFFPAFEQWQVWEHSALPGLLRRSRRPN
jgi:hypothetical protein